MVTDQQVRRFVRILVKDKTLEIAALKSVIVIPFKNVYIRRCL